MQFGLVVIAPYDTAGVVNILHWARSVAGDEGGVELRSRLGTPTAPTRRRLGVTDVRLPADASFRTEPGGLRSLGRLVEHSQPDVLQMMSATGESASVRAADVWPAPRAYSTPLALGDARVALGIRGAGGERIDLETEPRRARLWWAIGEFLLGWEKDGLGGATWIDAELLPHQVAVARHVLTAPSVSHVLADEVGLGKSVEALMIWSALSIQQPTLRTLVCAPRELIPQWCFEVRQRAEHRPRAGRYDDLPRVFVARAKKTSSAFESSDERGIVLVDHETIVGLKDFDQCDLLIVDEVHALTDDQRAAVENIASRSRHRLLLTATPSDVRKTYGAAVMRTSPLAWALRTVDPRGREASERWDDWLDEARALAIVAEEALNEGRAGEATERFWQSANQIAVARALSPPTRETESIGSAFRRLTPFDRLVRTRRGSLPPDTLPQRLLFKHQVDYRCEERVILKRLRDRAGRSVVAQRASSSWVAVRQITQMDTETRRLVLALGSIDARVDALLDVLASIWRESPSRKVVIRAQYAPTRQLLRETIEALLLRGALRRSPWEEVEQWKEALGLSGDDEVEEKASGSASPVAKRRGETDSVGPVAAVEKSQETVVDLLGEHQGLESESMLKHLGAFANLDLGGAAVLIAGDEAANGLNLQGVATDLILFELPWRPLLVEQWIGRLDRLGRRPDRAVRIHALWSEDAPDASLLEAYERLALFSRGFRSADDDEQLAQAIELAVETAEWQPVFDLATTVAAAYTGPEQRRSALDLPLPETLALDHEQETGMGLLAPLASAGFTLVMGDDAAKQALSWPAPKRGLSDAVALRQIREALRPLSRFGANTAGLAKDQRSLFLELRRSWVRRSADFLTPRHVLFRELVEEFIPDACVAAGGFRLRTDTQIPTGKYVLVLGRTCPAAAAQLAIWSTVAASASLDEVLALELEVLAAALERRVTADVPPRASRGVWRVEGGTVLGEPLDDLLLERLLVALPSGEAFHAPSNMERWVTAAEKALTRAAQTDTLPGEPVHAAVKRALEASTEYAAERAASILARRRRDVAGVSALLPGIRAARERALEAAGHAFHHLEQLPDDALRVANEALRVRAVAGYFIEVSA